MLAKNATVQTQHSRDNDKFYVSMDYSTADSSDASLADYAEIIVVRHGETAWNADRRIQGHLDVELNDVGRQQAAAVGDRLSKEKAISAVYSSDLIRAVETAQIIANKCGVPQVIQDPDLRERHLGYLQGLVLQEAAEINPDAYQASLSSRTDQEIPGGGESLDQLYHRCTFSLQKIGNKHKGERVVVVTHGGVLRAFHKRSTPTKKMPRKVPMQVPWKIPNASVNILYLADEEWRDWVIKTWADISHLSKTGYLESGFYQGHVEYQNQVKGCNKTKFKHPSINFAAHARLGQDSKSKGKPIKQANLCIKTTQ